MLKSVWRIGAVALVLVALFAATDMSASASSSSCSYKLYKTGAKTAKYSVSCNFNIKKVQGQANKTGTINGCTASNSNKNFTCTTHKTMKSYSATFNASSNVCTAPILSIKFTINGGTSKKTKIVDKCTGRKY